ncbi:hypothetical protein AMTR_s00224p00019690 [Amborella trichopoda]|uniref:Uncharacterized protein n=1 Tax=Amborella trichopoda TaxID=13333 RepID=W1P1J3_AMBTC|nr:hypothetical protein AMTR_s00224p00019690 [Amborella trichopoda]
MARLREATSFPKFLKPLTQAILGSAQRNGGMPLSLQHQSSFELFELYQCASRRYQVVILNSDFWQVRLWERVISVLAKQACMGVKLIGGSKRVGKLKQQKSLLEMDPFLVLIVISSRIRQCDLPHGPGA